jgi:hypothetical protein
MMNPALQPQLGMALTGRIFLKSSAVMRLLGYKDRGAFWDFVHRGGVPHVRLNARRIMFEEQALADWLAHRSSKCR